MKRFLTLAACCVLIINSAPARVIEVKVLGLVCNFCGVGIKKHLIKTKKVDKIKLDTERHLTYIYLLKNKDLTDQEIRKAIKNAGYKASKITRHEK